MIPRDAIIKKAVDLGRLPQGAEIETVSPCLVGWQVLYVGGVAYVHPREIVAEAQGALEAQYPFDDQSYIDACLLDAGAL